MPLVLPLVLMAVLLAHVAVLVLLTARVPRLPLHVAQCVTARLSLGERIRLSPLWTYTF
jgi:hypothetical protein